MRFSQTEQGRHLLDAVSRLLDAAYEAGKTDGEKAKFIPDTRVGIPPLLANQILKGPAQ
jgi:hypothetical protein